MVKKRKLAIFDIDGTIFRSSLVIELVNELVKQGYFPVASERKIEKNYLAWVNRVGHYDDYIVKVVEVYLENIKGQKVADIKKVVLGVISQHKGKVYRFTRDLIKELRSKNYFIIAVSGSPTHIVEEFTRQLGFDEFFGSVFEIKNGKFTGEFLINMSEMKKETLDKFVSSKKNLILRGSVGVGDTESDIPILELVENPIAFNPNLELAKIASKKGWRIVVERKDVIYDINKFELLTSASK